MDRTDDTFFSSREMIRTRGLHIRTFSQSVSTRLLSSLQCYKSTQRQVSVSSIVRDSTASESLYRSSPTSYHAYPRPISCHVSRCINTNSDPLLHTSYCGYSPTTTIPPKAKVIHTVPDPTTGFIMPFVVQSLLKPNRLFPVLGEIERVATNVVIHQHPSRR